MVPGFKGIASSITEILREGPIPHPFEGVTVINPDPLPTEAVTEFVVPPDV